jgi:hypothetical protein
MNDENRERFNFRINSDGGIINMESPIEEYFARELTRLSESRLDKRAGYRKFEVSGGYIECQPAIRGKASNRTRKQL